MKADLKHLVYALAEGRTGDALVLFANLNTTIDNNAAAIEAGRIEAETLRCKTAELAHRAKQENRDREDAVESAGRYAEQMAELSVAVRELEERVENLLAQRIRLQDECKRLAALCDEHRHNHEAAGTAKGLFKALHDERSAEDAKRIQALEIQVHDYMQQPRNGDAELRREIAELTAELDRCAEEVDSLADLRDDLYEEREALLAQITSDTARFAREMGARDDALEVVGEERDILKAKLVEADDVIAAMDDSHKGLQAQYDVQCAENRQIKLDSSAAQAAHKVTLRQLAQVEKLVATRDGTITALQARDDALSAEIAELRTARDALGQMDDRKTAAFQQRTTELTTAETKAHEMQASYNRLLAERDEYVRKFATAARELTRERADLAELRRAVQGRQVDAVAQAARAVVG